MTPKEMRCEEALRQIFAYVDRELGAGEYAAVQQHLHICKSCFSRMEFERVLKGKVRALRDERPTPGVSERVKRLLKNF